MDRFNRRDILKSSVAGSLALSLTRGNASAIASVETADGLIQAIQNAKAGETIRIKPNAALGSVTIDGTAFDGPVTIDTPDQTRASLPTINKLVLVRCKNLQFRNIRFEGSIGSDTKGWEQCVSLRDCQAIGILESEFVGKRGPEDRPENQIYSGTGVGRGVELGTSEGVLIQGCNFTWLSEAVNVDRCHDVTIDNNTIRYCSNNGILVIGGSDYKITRNKIGDFRVSPRSGLHLDGIQFGTPGLTEPVTDILIDGNDVFTGDDGHWEMQGIFGRNEAVDMQQGGKAMFYRNVTITNNEVRPWGTKPWPRDQLNRPLIQLDRQSTGVSIENNVARLGGREPKWVVKNNKDPYR
jgi:parallel beta-helix repeat protein